ncbi:hypothetical protein D3C75_605160 [compost metagenome]
MCSHPIWRAEGAGCIYDSTGEHILFALWSPDPQQKGCGCTVLRLHDILAEPSHRQDFGVQA